MHGQLKAAEHLIVALKMYLVHAWMALEKHAGERSKTKAYLHAKVVVVEETFNAEKGRVKTPRARVCDGG